MSHVAVDVRVRIRDYSSYLHIRHISAPVAGPTLKEILCRARNVRRTAIGCIDASKVYAKMRGSRVSIKQIQSLQFLRTCPYLRAVCTVGEHRVLVQIGPRDCEVSISDEQASGKCSRKHYEREIRRSRHRREEREIRLPCPCAALAHIRTATKRAIFCIIAGSGILSLQTRKESRARATGKGEQED